jgi:hypothetical protein
MGTFIAHQTRELANRVGKMKADILMGLGRYRQEHPPGVAICGSHTMAQQTEVGSRAFNRRRIRFLKAGRF